MLELIEALKEANGGGFAAPPEFVAERPGGGAPQLPRREPRGP